MYVTITLTLDVGEQDSTQDAIESAKNQIRSMEIEEVLNIVDCVVEV